MSNDNLPAGDAEQPTGWASVVLGTVAELVSGVGFPEAYQRQAGFPYPFFKVGSLAQVRSGRALEASEHTISAEVAHELRARVLPAGSVLFAKIGMAIRLNRRRQLGRPACIDNNLMAAIPSDAIDDRYLLRYLETVDLMPLTQATTVPSLRKSDIERLSIPLPPLAEQRRIADAVEALLARVEASRARLDRVPAILKRFRQSVLAAACSGRLTEDWRRAYPCDESADEMILRCAESGDSGARPARRRRRNPTTAVSAMSPDGIPISWTVRTLSDLVTSRLILDVQDGNHGELYPRKTDFGPTGAVFLTAKQVMDGRVLLDEAPRLRMDKARQLRIGFAQSGDVLLTHNATVGRAAVLREAPDPCLLGTSVTYHRPNRRFLDADYYCRFLQGPLWQEQLAMVMEQTTRNQVPITKQVQLSVVVPPVDEQREIARRVEALFTLADSIERRVAAARKQADALPQAILLRAFSGKLVPTEAELARREGRDYEPASVLLERIRQEREASSQTTRRPRTRRPQ